MRWVFYIVGVTVLVTLSISCQQSHTSELLSSISDVEDEISEQELESNVLALVSFGTRNSYSDRNSKTRGIGAAQAWLESKFKALEDGEQFKVFTDCFKSSGHTMCNVGAIQKGSVSPDKYFVVSGHYDSMASSSRDNRSDAPGADDDASGTSVVLEVARVLSQYEVPVSVIYLATVGEEQGLLGARHFAATLKKGGINVVGMITNDIVGSSDGPEGSAPNRLRVYSDWNGKYTPESKALAQKVAKTVEAATEKQFTLDLKPAVDRKGRSGDHVAFLEQGYPAIRFIEPFEDLRHQHQNVGYENGSRRGDLPEFLEYDYMARVVLANIVAIGSAN